MVIKTAKRIVLVMLAMNFICAAMACAPFDDDGYSDFLTDLDIVMRFEVCFDDIREGRDTWYTTGELKTLIRDLDEGYTVGTNSEAENATRHFQDAARSLIAFLQDESRPSESFENAREDYERALAEAGV